MSRHLALVLTVSLLLLAGCSGGGAEESGPTTTGDPWAGWDAGAGSRITQLGAQIAQDLPGECNDLAPLDYSMYASTAQTLQSDIPLGVADCTTLGETIELSTFADDPARTQFVDQRVGILCAAAKRGKYSLEGVRWVTDEDWSVQVDTEGTGRKLADVLGGSYQSTLCPGTAQMDWEPAAVATVEQLAQQLTGDPIVKCDQLQLVDRSTYAKLSQYAGRLPAAYARCDGPGSTVVWIAAFSPATVDPDSFAQSEASALCASGAVGKDVQAVRGPNWAIIATSPKLAERAATATGGEALTPAC